MEGLIFLGILVIVALLANKKPPPPAPKAENSCVTDLYQPKVTPTRPALEPIQTTNISAAKPPPIPVSKTLRGRAYVIDGDTIIVQKVKVRLAGIDAPELDKPWGQKAKWEMVRICKGEVLDVKLTGETSYDRLVGTCYLSDGRDIGAEIVRSGLALDGGYYSKGKYRHLEPPGIRAKLIKYGHRGKGVSKV
ncbi:MAG: thermonuclease family protein [Pseudomonadota bacterium]